MPITMPSPPRRSRSAMSFSVLIAAVVLGSRAAVEAAEIRARDGIHRTQKVAPIVTAAPDAGLGLGLGLELRKRAKTACPADYQLCPESLSGGCCAEGFACATDSCFATTQGPQTCAGRVGFYACGPEVGGGCCPVGSVCKRGSKCLPMSGVSYSHECSASSFLCPSELGYGCCPNGMGCGINQCYSTDPSTYVHTKTMTTTSDDETQTITTTVTTTSTPQPPAATAEAPSNTALNKFFPSFVPKQEPLITEDNGGLSKSQLGGVVGGAIALLIIILAIGFFIISYLKRVVKAVEDAPSSSKGSSGSSPPTRQFKRADSERDSMSANPLIVSGRASHRRGDSDSDAPTPQGWLSPEIRGTPPASSHNNGYQAVPTTGGERVKHGSLDSVSGQSYFDQLPLRGAQRHSDQSARNRPIRSGSDPPGTSTHSSTRMRSNTNETMSDNLSSGQQTPSELESNHIYVAELPGTAVTDMSRRRSGSGSGSVPRPAPVHQRRRSDGAGHGRSDSAAGMGTPQLDVVAEQAESHGHYGPPDKAVGQTAAQYPSSSL